MTPVYQTKDGNEGNCFAACVASILERKIEDVDVDVTGVPFRTLLGNIEKKAGCKIYYATYPAIVDGIVKTSERYCFVSVCSCSYGDPYSEESVWHTVVSEIANGKISLVFNPDKTDERQKSLDQFQAIGNVFFVKANASNL